ncbi:MAG: amidohydrolase family protein [bacterium]|nr:amidohydrolase family protein [bacterium]
MKKIDIHAHYGYWPFPILAESESDALRIMQEAGIEKCIFSSAKAVQYDFVAGNAELAPLLDRNPECYGYITLNPNYLVESEKEIEKYHTHPKWVGVKLHPSYNGHPIDSAANIKLITMAESANLPLLIHTYDFGDAAPRRVLSVRERCPDIPIIMAHMGGNNWKEGIDVAEKTDKVYLDIVCSVFDYDKVGEAIDRVGVNKLVFGTDLTLIHPAIAISMFEAINLTEADKKKIYYTTALKIFPKLGN